MEADPDELHDLAGDPAWQSLTAELLAEVGSQWDLPRLKTEVLQEPAAPPLRLPGTDDRAGNTLGLPALGGCVEALLPGDELLSRSGGAGPSRSVNAHTRGTLPRNCCSSLFRRVSARRVEPAECRNVRFGVVGFSDVAAVTAITVRGAEAVGLCARDGESADPDHFRLPAESEHRSVSGQLDARAGGRQQALPGESDRSRSSDRTWKKPNSPWRCRSTSMTPGCRTLRPSRASPGRWIPRSMASSPARPPIAWCWA